MVQWWADHWPQGFIAVMQGDYVMKPLHHLVPSGKNVLYDQFIVTHLTTKTFQLPKFLDLLYVFAFEDGFGIEVHIMLSCMVWICGWYLTKDSGPFCIIQLSGLT